MLRCGPILPLLLAAGWWGQTPPAPAPSTSPAAPRSRAPGPVAAPAKTSPEAPAAKKAPSRAVARPPVVKAPKPPKPPSRPAYEIYLKNRNGVVLIRTVRGLGSGFFVSDRLVVTNYHVIEDGRRIEVTAFNGKKARGEVIVSDRKNDLALIRLDKKLPGTFPLKLAEDLPPLGTLVVAIGHPYGHHPRKHKRLGMLRWSWSSGLLINASRYVVQSSAPIYPGNSGGPILDYRGQVIGVNSYKVQEGSVLGFGIHISHVRKLLKMKRTGYVRTLKMGLMGGYAASIAVSNKYATGNNLQVGFNLTWDELQLTLFFGASISANRSMKAGFDQKQPQDLYWGIYLGYRFAIPLMGAGVFLTPFTGFVGRHRSFVESTLILQDPNCTQNCVFATGTESSSYSFRPIVPVGLRFGFSFFSLSAAFWADTRDIEQSTVNIFLGLSFG